MNKKHVKFFYQSDKRTIYYEIKKEVPTHSAKTDWKALLRKVITKAINILLNVFIN